MKRFSTIMMGALAALMMFSFTSCDEDEDIAFTLEGAWEGDMESYTRAYGGAMYDPSMVTISFYKDNNGWSTGTGYWKETFGSNWRYSRNYFVSRITYNVTMRDINIRFLDDHDHRITIRDYSLTNNRFSGYFYEGNSRVEFVLYHVAGPNWGSYEYGWSYYDNYYYGNEAKMDLEENTPSSDNLPAK